MIQALTDLPDGVIGFALRGKLEATDYADTLLPAIEQAARAGGVRVVLVFEEFDGLTGGAVWEDLKMGVEHLAMWKRIALVTDIEWMTHLVSLFGWMTPGACKVFPVESPRPGTSSTSGPPSPSTSHHSRPRPAPSRTSHDDRRRLGTAAPRSPLR